MQHCSLSTGREGGQAPLRPGGEGSEFEALPLVQVVTGLHCVPSAQLSTCLPHAPHLPSLTLTSPLLLGPSSMVDPVV